MIFDSLKYINDIHKPSEILDISHKNNFCDYVAIIDHHAVTLEVKERSANYPDILLEGIQDLKILRELRDVNNKNVNKIITPQKLHTALGWFYKTKCDRLIYAMPDSVYDLEWRGFEEFVISKLEYDCDIDEEKTVTLNCCLTTTGSISYLIKFSEIPKSLYIHNKNLWQK